MTALFDTHAHLQDRAFEGDRAQALQRARAAGVDFLVVIGETESSSRAGVDLAARDSGVWAAVGLHPHNARLAGPDFDRRLRTMAALPRVVAIGEIGLDYHYDRSPRDKQIEMFELQLGVAAVMDLPVSVHSREAERDTMAILEAFCSTRREAGARTPYGVMHCFGYGADAALRCAELGLMVSVPGTVTYRNADATRAVARETPDDWLVIETDSPVLAPQSRRGRRNEPAYLRETAEYIVELRGVDLQSLAAVTTANARRLFRLEASELAAEQMEGARA